jgi:hypothetical protein
LAEKSFLRKKAKNFESHDQAVTQGIGRKNFNPLIFFVCWCIKIGLKTIKPADWGKSKQRIAGRSKLPAEKSKEKITDTQIDTDIHRLKSLHKSEPICAPKLQ